MRERGEGVGGGEGHRHSGRGRLYTFMQDQYWSCMNVSEAVLAYPSGAVPNSIRIPDGIMHIALNVQVAAAKRLPEK